MKRKILFIAFMGIAIFSVGVFFDKHPDLWEVFINFFLSVISQKITFSVQDYFFTNLFLSLGIVFILTLLGKITVNKMIRYW